MFNNLLNLWTQLNKAEPEDIRAAADWLIDTLHKYPPKAYTPETRNTLRANAYLLIAIADDMETTSIRKIS